jgi:pimeloyl-ACP methyl ester carboxylesterase
MIKVMSSPRVWKEEHGRAAGIKFSSYGSGLALFLFHGFGGKPEDWKFLIEGLASNFRVIIPNLSSITLSEPRLSFQEQVNHLHRFIDELVGEKASVGLLGASYGGALTWAINATLGGRVVESIYINPMPPFPGRYLQHGFFRPFLFLSRFEWISYLLLSTPPGKSLVKYLLDAFYNEWPERVTSVGRLKQRHRRIVARILKRFNDLLHSTDWRGWSSKISTMPSPSLLIVGGRDRLFRYGAYESLQQSLGSCELVVISELSHRVSESVVPQITQLIAKRFDNHFEPGNQTVGP